MAFPSNPSFFEPRRRRLLSISPWTHSSSVSASVALPSPNAALSPPLSIAPSPLDMVATAPPEMHGDRGREIPMMIKLWMSPPSGVWLLVLIQSKLTVDRLNWIGSKVLSCFCGCLVLNRSASVRLIDEQQNMVSTSVLIFPWVFLLLKCMKTIYIYIFFFSNLIISILILILEKISNIYLGWEKFGSNYFHQAPNRRALVTRIRRTMVPI